ncbi:MAG: deoxynucleoside kinase [Candidatus Cloacimonetes bacterium]|nr:deoxynucleoside kinase [Candidatus Cloacimonadota bacterium]
MEHLRIGIIGNIGVGKSTLVEAASNHPFDKILLDSLPDKTGEEKVYAFKEEFNPKVLDAFYHDPIAKAFMAQIEFFNGRLNRRKKIHGYKGIILEDRTLAEDYYIFGMAQKIQGNMTEEEFLVYQRTFHLMTEKIDDPDLMIYLRADVETLQHRINERGRESETKIPQKYLQLLNDLYEKFISRHCKCPILIIDATEKIPFYEYITKTIYKIAEEIKSLDLRVTTPGISKWVTLPQTEATLKAVDAERKLEKYLKDNPTLIAVAGNVGLGKSTLSAIMSRCLMMNGLYEKPEKNPLLEKFLHNKKKYCFDLQLHFLQMRTDMQKRGKSDNHSYVMDRSLPEDLLVFCYQFYQDGILNSDQLDILSVEFKKINDTLLPVDLLIILKGSADLAWNRIQQRGREMEIQGGWSNSEIENLNKWYENYANDVRKFGFHDGPILELDMEKLDLNNRVHVGYIFEQILNLLEEKKN